MTMIMIDKAVVEQALAAMVSCDFDDAVNTLNEALAQPQPVQEPVAYLDIGAGGYLDIATNLTDEQLLALPKGRHALVIAGTFGIDGYTSPQAAQPQQPLSEEEIQQLKLDCGYDYYSSYEVSAAFIHGVKAYESVYGITKGNA